MFAVNTPNGNTTWTAIWMRAPCGSRTTVHSVYLCMYTCIFYIFSLPIQLGKELCCIQHRLAGEPRASADLRGGRIVLELCLARGHHGFLVGSELLRFVCGSTKPSVGLSLAHGSTTQWACGHFIWTKQAEPGDGCSLRPAARLRASGNFNLQHRAA